MNPRILIIDDDEGLVEVLVKYLSGFGFEVASAHTPSKGMEEALKTEPDLLILDVMLPEQDGFSFLKELRKTSDLPVIMLTARGDLTDRVVGLELGADDYLPKPFEPRELVARIQTILRRSKANAKPPKDFLDFGDLKFDLKRHQVTLKEEHLELTSTEYDLLLLFAEHPGEVLSRETILDKVAGIEWESYNRTIDVLVSRLRHKLGDDPKHPTWLKTQWGAGYLFLGDPR